MIDYETFCKIRAYRENQGLKVAQIARALGLHPCTVAKWVRMPQYRRRQAAPRRSKLDPFKPQIIRLLESHPYSAAQIFQHLREGGYPGGHTIVKDYVSQVRPKPRPAFLTLTFAPGEAAQVDWGEYGKVQVGSTRRRLSFFVMVLCYSRLMYLEFTVSQTMEHFLACHQHALEAFQGVPGKIMVDNLKSAVLKRLTGEAPVFHPRFYEDSVVKPPVVCLGFYKRLIRSLVVRFYLAGVLHVLSTGRQPFIYCGPVGKRWRTPAPIEGSGAVPENAN